jgi:predicted nuclease of predicted toxin-antitoxin system
LKLKIDENLPNGCAGILRGKGFAADTVTDERLTGAEDSAMALKSQGEGRVPITLDLDFANIRAYLRQSTPVLLSFGRRVRTNALSWL